MSKPWLLLALALGTATLTVGCHQATPDASIAVDEAGKGSAPVEMGKEWRTDYDAAFVQAKTEGKHVMVDFTGTTWCPPCIALDKEVFATQTFKDYAEKNLVLLKVEFASPVSDPPPHSESLLKLLDGQVQLPTVLVLSSEGKLLGRTGYQPGGPSVLLKDVDDLLKQKVE